MDAVRTQAREIETEPGWQGAFLAKLPQIEAQLSYAFRHFPAEEREDAMQEGMPNCLVRYEQLV